MMSASWPAAVYSGAGEVLADGLAAVVSDRGSPGAVLLSGPPGCGKSTTLRAVGQRLTSRGFRVYQLVADEVSYRQPYGLVSALLGVDLAQPPPAGTAERVLGVVDVLCAEGPVALCVDDAHLADGDSLSVLGQLASAAHDLPLVLGLARRGLPRRAGLEALAARPDVHVAEVVGLDEAGVDALVGARCGAPAGASLRRLFEAAQGNPFHLLSLLDDLRRRELIAVVDGLAEVCGDAPRVLPSVHAAVRAHLALLEAPVRELSQVLAVWGGAASMEQLAAVLGAAPASLLGPAQAGVDAGVLRWTVQGRLAFSHDLYRDVTYADLPAGPRRVLHASCAAQLRVSGAGAALVAHHVRDAAAGPDASAAAALRAAAAELVHAPAQAADLLAAAAGLVTTEADADAVALARAGALAAAGQVGEAERVARERLKASTDPVIRAALRRLMCFCLISAARIGDALALIDETLALPVEDAAREALVQVRRWAVILGGREPIRPAAPADPGVGSDSGAALVPEAIEAFLRGDCERALSLGLRAAEAREAHGAPAWSDGASAPVWPPWFALYAHGPAAARELSLRARRAAQETGRGWLVPYHQFISAAINYLSGQWDDALAEFDTGLEAASATGTGWLTRAVAGQLQIQTTRGQLDTAAIELARWKARGLPDQFGLPQMAFAEALLDEAQGRPEHAARLARRCWISAMDGGRTIWALLAGPDTARIALVAGDGDLLARVRSDTAALPTRQPAALAPAIDLVTAMAARDPDRATTSATAFQAVGNVAGEVGAWEEAAVAAAEREQADRARTLAARASQLAATLGARTVERRLAARLREHVVRLGVTGPRRRPTTGWDSLTPTELRIAELVGQGLTSPQIGSRLYISARTVQTHISHTLRKLGLRSRVELATAVTRRT